MENIRIGVAAIIENKGKILFGKRLSTHGQGTWGFIGGHLETGETYAVCIKREAMEEAGVEISDIRFAGLTEEFYENGKHYLTIFIKADIVDISRLSVQEPDKMTEWCWIDKETLPDNMFMPINNLIKNGYRF